MAEPESSVLDWAVRTLRPGGELVEVRDLHDGVGPWLLRCMGSSSSGVSSGILRVGAEEGSDGKVDDYVRIEAAALRAIEGSGGLAPRLLGLDADGGETGRVASLQSVLVGQPVFKTRYSRDLLYSLGAILAKVHKIIVKPSANLPVRKRSLEPGEGSLDVRRRFAGSARWVAGERLFRAARLELAQHPRPADRVGLVHGDAWTGNAMAVGDRCVGLFDWGCAGVGHPGIDLGHTRMSAVLDYHMSAGDDVLAGWEAEAGEPLASTAYWDIVGALLSPPDIGGKTDIRDEFLLRALERLRRHRE